MATIFLLAIAAAVFPLLIASVAILISRPRPRRLLLAFYAGGMTASIVCGVLLVVLFRHGDSLAGNTESSPQPWLSLVGGAVALCLAWLMVTPRGQRLMDRVHHRFARPQPRPQQDGPSWVERRLDGSIVTLFVAGAVINLPGPYYVIALGHIAEGNYSVLGRSILIVSFNLIMFLLLEVPIVGYAVDAEKTTKLVGLAREWLTSNGLRITGALVGLYGAGLVIQGITALA